MKEEAEAKVKAQGDIVRKLKADKAPKDQVYLNWHCIKKIYIF